MTSPADRDIQSLFKAIKECTEYTRCKTEDAFIYKCRRLAQNSNPFVGNAKRTRKHQEIEDTPTGEVMIDPLDPWTLNVANTVLRVSQVLMEKLLSDRFFSYICEWCETPRLYQPGVAYTNLSLRYVDTPTSDGVYVEQVQRNASNNLYLRIPHPLQDTVSVAIMDQLEVYYQNSFWRIPEVFECIQAAQALCKRGINVDRLFIGMSPGGVGQSVFSAHLAAIYGHNHHYYDPNVWCNDDEMRKQVEGIAGAVVFTGQEAPDNARHLKEDLFKRFITGEGITGRRPYGITTRMMRITGWKRLEVNRPMQFTGVTEHNFNSVLRRALVYEISARFMDATLLKEIKFRDHESRGIFAVDPNLQSFVTSAPAVAGALRIQHGFESQHNAEACIGLIEQYASRGGDNGLTAETMRRSCGLVSQQPSSGADVISAAILQQIVGDPMTGDGDTLATCKDASEHAPTMALIIDYMLGRNSMAITYRMFTYVPRLGTKKDQKDVLWQALLKSGAMKLMPGNGDVRAYPSMRPVRPMSDVVAVQLDADARDQIQSTAFPELIDLHGLESLYHNQIRLANVEIYKHALESSKLSGISGVKKIISKADVADQSATPGKKGASSYAKLCAAERHSKKLVEWLNEKVPSPVKKRRTGRRQADPEVDMVKTLATYRYTQDNIRTRRQLSDMGSQRMTRAQLAVAVPHTVDLDIVNCSFTILHQLVEKMDPQQLSKKDRELLRRCALDRDALCAEMAVTLAEGKEALVAVLNGKQVRDEDDGAPILKQVQRLGRCLRWLSWESMPLLHRRLSEDAQKQNPDTGMIFHMWSAIEDIILEKWSSYIMEHHRPQHLSLHFDGMRVRCPDMGNVDAFCRDCAAHILSTTGFNVTIRPKVHKYVLDVYNGRSEACPSMSHEGDWSTLSTAGYCIPAAMAALFPAIKSDIEMKLQANSTTHHSYEWVTDARQMGLTVEYWAMEDDWVRLHDGKYLMHVDGASGAHCVGLIVRDNQAETIVFEVGQARQAPMSALTSAILEGMDRSKIVIFSVHEDKTLESSSRRTLRRLQAGAGSSGSTDPYVPNRGAEPDEVDTADLLPAEQLIASLKTEVTAAIQKTLKCNEVVKQCPLCPFRQFDRTSRVVTHLKQYHVEKHRWSPSGTKMLKTIMALWDHDQMATRTKAADQDIGYAERAASVVRSSVDPALPTGHMGDRVDRALRLILDADGPRYVHRDHVEGPTRAPLRRIGNFFITRKFAIEAFVQAVMAKSSINSTQMQMEEHMTRSGSRLVSLVPGGHRWWETLLEDVFFSPACDRIWAEIRAVWLERREFESVSIDCTFRSLYSLKGQAPHTAPRSTQQAQALDPETALHALCTVKGATGGVLLLSPLRTEGASYICEEIGRWSEEERHQVRHVATDDPSRHLMHSLQKICPNLRYMSLDGMHLVFRYEQAFGRATTASSTFLKKVIARTTGQGDGTSSSVGPIYTGVETLVPGLEEQNAIRMVADGSMAEDEATNIVNNIDSNRPIVTRLDFIKHLAALRVVWHDEGDRRLPNNSQITLREVLVNACVAGRIEWLLNYRRYVETVDDAWGKQLTAGTTSNEAFHRELNHIFDLVHEMHQATLRIKVRIILFQKGIPHMRAIEGDLLRQRRPQRVLGRAIHSVHLWDDAQWQEWCGTFIVNDRVVRRRSALANERLAQSIAVRNWTRKKPAAAQPKVRPFKHRRTPFRRRTGVEILLRRPAAIGNDTKRRRVK